MSEVVLITTPDATAQLTLNRSESCNALKVETAQALTRALLDVGADPVIHGVIITGRRVAL